MLFRSLRSTARRALAAGAVSALALTLFNTAQPSLGDRKVHPGTVKDVRVTLTPAPVAGPAPAVDSPGRATPRSATLSHRGPEPAAGSVQAAPRGSGSGAGSVQAAPQGSEPGGGSAKAAPAAGMRLLSGPVTVGKARFVGFSWPDPTPGGCRPRGAAGAVWLRARTAAGWSGWREVEPAADGPDATSPEYRPGRLYSDGQWLDTGTTEVQLRVDPPATTGQAGKAGAAAAGLGQTGSPTGHGPWRHAHAGMLSQAQLRQLMATRGQDFDLLFLEMMSAHHQGAIEMANSELRDSSRPEVRRLAQQIIDDQQAEIDQFEQWQQEWAAAPVR